jgi:asparagine synthase (glutamine-hydrolysing)
MRRVETGAPMTGFVGGAVAGTLRAMADEMHHEPWYEHEFFEEGTHGLGFAHHGARDPLGHTTWQDDGCVGVVHGAIANHDSSNEGALFQRVLDNPTSVADLDGSFVIACLDARGNENRIVVATDKLGTRPCYYADDRVLFGTSLAALLVEYDDPTVDEQAVSDMLLLGNLWGDRTLIEEANALTPATVLEYTDEGEARTERYWKPDFESAPRQGYIPELKARYRRAIDETSTTIGNTGGLWLSGGLDSRTLAAGLSRNAGRTFGSLTAYTYDANPRGGGNPALARRTAERLGIDAEEIVMTPDRFLDVLETTVDLTDGMLRWSSLLNLSTVFDLAQPPNVLMEASGQGELVGQHPRRYTFTECDSAVEGLVRSEQMVDTDTVESLLTTDTDPLRTFEETVARSDERTQRGKMLDVHYTNYYSRMTFASDAVPRSQAGTRVPFAHRDFLEHTAKLPVGYRMGTYRFTDGAIPYGITRPKHELARGLGNGLSRIPYERTGLGPNRPFVAHLAGFVIKTGSARLRSAVAYGGAHEPDVWYRRHNGLRARIDDLLRGACERPWFDAEAIRRLRREHLRGEENHMTTSLAALTTLECWFRRHLD